MIRLTSRLALLAGAAGLAVACSSLVSKNGPEKRRDRIRIPHAKHVAAEVECLTCHEEIYDAKDLNANFRPPEDICLQCHAEEKKKGNCGFCHLDVRFAGPYPKRDRPIQLSHADHIERVDEDCARCHRTLPEKAPAANLTPPMKQCMSCHEHENDFAKGNCERCHQSLARFPLKPVSVFSHAANFVQTHHSMARSAVDTCAKCHDQTFCADCHANTVSSRISLTFAERLDRRFIHRNDFVGRHMIEARADPALCQRCHGTSFCDSCHQLQNLTPLGVSPRSPHPVGWGFPTSAKFHGDAARRDIANCAPCHDQGSRSICVDCHKVGGVGGNPHPASWIRRHDDRKEIQDNAMCRYCHL